MLVFLQSVWYRAMYLFCAKHRVDNIEMLLLLVSRSYTIGKVFSAFPTARLVSRLGLHGKFRKDVVVTAYPN